jgi:BirA family biotin operon repressor/biotin-[acetyl-CoA-carboxylase] ligase
VQLAAETVEGDAVDLDDDGHLVVEVDGGRRAFAVGDVVHLRAPGA